MCFSTRKEIWNSGDLYLALLGGAQPVILQNLYSMFMNIMAWGPQVNLARILDYENMWNLFIKEMD